MSSPWTGKRTTWHSVSSSTMVRPASSWDEHLKIGVSESTLSDVKILYLLHTRLNLSYSEWERGRHLRSNHNTQTDVLISRLALQVPDNVGNIWFEVSNHITSLHSFSKSPVVCSIYSPCFRSRQLADHVWSSQDELMVLVFGLSQGRLEWKKFVLCVDSLEPKISLNSPLYLGACRINYVLSSKYHYHHQMRSEWVNKFSILLNYT